VMFRLFRTATAIAFALVALPAMAIEDRPVDFNRDIRPILSDKCFACHGPDEKERKSGLRLDREVSAKSARHGHHAIVPGKPDQSHLIDRITNNDSELRMPPPKSGKTLTAAEIETLRRWIEQGAGWSGPWAYVPPKRHPVPNVKDTAWPLGWIDRFVLARLEAERLRPSAETDRVTLIRRLYFDLIGLPPSPEEVEAFVTNQDAKAYEQLVDRLLASEHFGERMAMYWLDLVRYADTVGYHGDQEHHASPYRDYVIDAFNLNLPFDQFTREQLAGDLVPDSGPDQQIASCYNRLLQTSHEGGVQAKEYLAIYAADRVRNISNVWMGATMGCAQCHNHKFDPYTTREFYSMAAFFADLDEDSHLKKGSDTNPTKRAPEVALLTRRERERLDALSGKIAELEKQLTATPPEQSESGEAIKKQLATLTDQRDAIQESARLVMISVAKEPRTIRILPRGNWLDDSGEIVEPAVPEFLGKLAVTDRRATRLDLANWLTDAEHGAGGLTARVFVNRLWYLLFGVGIAKSLEDFGGQGEPPVHPELLDNLAIEFVESGWDVKHMVKLLVMSRAYRQSSLESPEMRERDPENRLVARQSRFRLPAEVVRDNSLEISGLLVRDVGGASAHPYQPAGYYKYLNFPTREYQSDTDARQWRRGVYVHWQRTYLHPMLKAFDASTREECTAQRPRSNTPLAALVLLNDPSFVEAARALASRTIASGGPTDDTRLDYVFRRAVTRPPDDFERATLGKLLATNRQQYRAAREDADKLIRTGQAPVALDIDAAELAAWTAVCRVILNLNETVTRN
jgi:mono/diheme cytochrome c family protein